MFARGSGGIFRNDVSGTATIEFAILGPVMLAMIFGIVTFGWGINGIMSVRFALERSSRAFLLDPTMTQSQLSSLVAQKVAYLGIKNINVTLTVDPPSSGFKIAHATASYAFTIPVPLLDDYPIGYRTSVDIPVRN